jgi:hypothetical protein
MKGTFQIAVSAAGARRKVVIGAEFAGKRTTATLNPGQPESRASQKRDAISSN